MSKTDKDKLEKKKADKAEMNKIAPDQCKNIVDQVRNVVRQHEKIANRMYNMYRTFFSEKNRIYGSIGYSLAAEYSFLNHMFTNTAACETLITDLNGFLSDFIIAFEEQVIEFYQKSLITF